MYLFWSSLWFIKNVHTRGILLPKHAVSIIKQSLGLSTKINRIYLLVIWILQFQCYLVVVFFSYHYVYIVCNPSLPLHCNLFLSAYSLLWNQYDCIYSMGNNKPILATMVHCLEDHLSPSSKHPVNTNLFHNVH